MPATTLRTAKRTHAFRHSVIREMTRVAQQHDAINLAQGFPDFPAPDLLKQAALDAIRDDVNQYAVTWGAPRLREAIVAKYRDHYDLEIDRDREVTVTCGATEALAAVMLAIVDPGDEVLVLEPFYENYGPDAVLCGAKPVFVTLDPPGFELDETRLRAAVTPRTRALVMNTPNNPTGKVFTREEVEIIAAVCREHDLICVTDEIYEYIVFEGEHVPVATLDGMRDRSVIISGCSKTFSVTGWRVGTIVAPPDLTDAIHQVHDFLTVGAPAPLQEACAVAMERMGRDYYDGLSGDYRARRDALLAGLRDAGFRCEVPQGAFYVLGDFTDIDGRDDHTFAKALAKDARVATVPGSSFFHAEGVGRNLLRFAFCKRIETLEEAADRLRTFAGRGA